MNIDLRNLTILLIENTKLTSSKFFKSLLNCSKVFKQQSPNPEKTGWELCNFSLSAQNATLRQPLELQVSLCSTCFHLPNEHGDKYVFHL